MRWHNLLYVKYCKLCSVDNNMQWCLNIQDDKARLQKQKDEQKALKEMAAKAAKGPLGNNLCCINYLIYFLFNDYDSRWIIINLTWFYFINHRRWWY